MVLSVFACGEALKVFAVELWSMYSSVNLMKEKILFLKRPHRAICMSMMDWKSSEASIPASCLLKPTSR